MCGIIAYCGENRAEPILFSGLKQLEYRGYDSVGIACHEAEGFVVHKEVGKVQDLERQCSARHKSGIGHCRWATHGAVTRENAHPHESSDGQVVLVHNGIIENYLELRQFLIEEKFSFNSQSDTETIVNLLAYLLQRETSLQAEVPSQGETSLQDKPLRAMQSLENWLQGSYALAVMFAARPHEIYALRHESPLVVGLGGQQGNYLASDVLPLLEYTQEVIYLENHEVACISLGQVQIYNATGQQVEPQVQKLTELSQKVDKQGYDHFMAKEIFEQPRIFGNLFRHYVDSATWKLRFEFNPQQQRKLQDVERIIFVSCGTSYHSSIYAKYVLEKYCAIPVEVEYASEFRYREPQVSSKTLVFGLSQSGETADTLAALRLAIELGGTTLALVNVASSSMARLVDLLLCSHCGPEIGVASTKVYTAQLAILYYFTLYLAELRGRMEPEDLLIKLQDSQKLPELAQRILDKDGELYELGRAYAGYQHMLYLGRGLYYPLALEGALKLKELSYIHAEGYAAAEMKHGPIALIDTRMPVVVLVPQNAPKMHSNIQEVRARGARILAFAHNNEPYNDCFTLPSLSPELDPLLFALPLQLFAYHIAVAKGMNPDQPRNLAKSVTVE